MAAAKASGKLTGLAVYGTAAVALVERSQLPPRALINWTLAVICCTRRLIAVR